MTLTRGSTAVMVLLGIMCLVCLFGSLARQKTRSRCFEPIDSCKLTLDRMCDMTTCT